MRPIALRRAGTGLAILVLVCITATACESRTGRVTSTTVPPVRTVEVDDADGLRGRWIGKQTTFQQERYLELVIEGTPQDLRGRLRNHTEMPTKPLTEGIPMALSYYSTEDASIGLSAEIEQKTDHPVIASGFSYRLDLRLVDGALEGTYTERIQDMMSKDESVVLRKVR